jgi:hypothetical protein
MAKKPDAASTRPAPVVHHVRHVGVVAQCRRLPDLHPELRRLERGWRRRHRRHPQPSAVSARPGRRRYLDHALVSVADGRRRLRRCRLPGNRPALRRPRRSPGADRGCACRRPAADDRHRPEPHVGGTPVVPRSSGGRPGVTGSRPLLLPRRARGRRRGTPEQLAERLRRAGLDCGPQRWPLASPVVPASFRRVAARPRLGRLGGPGGLREDSPLLARPRCRRLPDRRRLVPTEGAGPAGRPRTVRRHRAG